MYQSILFIHSYLRWVVLLLMIVVIARSVLGLINKSDYKKSDNSLAAALIGSVHLQLLLGLILYIFLSPLTAAAFNDFGAAMKNSVLRYWAVEHLFAMVVATALAQIGRTKARKAIESSKKFRFQLIFFLISLLIMLSRIPFAEPERLFR